MTISQVRTSRPAKLPAPDGTLGHVGIGTVVLENGSVLPDVTVALQRWGELSPDRDNVILALHALTGDSHATGPAGGPDGHLTAGWWDGMIGPGAVIDTNEWCVISTNVLGGCSGTTGPGSTAPDGKAWGSRFPVITVRDEVEVERILLERLGIDRVASVAGGSMGGARALEWQVTHPDRVGSSLVLAADARTTAYQIGYQGTQIQAIAADPDWLGGDYYGTGRAPDIGLGIARRFAHLSYRGEAELDDRFANKAQEPEDPAFGGRFAVQSYLDHQAGKLLGRFDAGSYVVLTRSLNLHDVGRGRGGVSAALRDCPVPTVVAAIDSDQLYPLHTLGSIADDLPNCAGLQVISSPYGHDAFLIEADAVAALIGETMDLARASRR